MAGCFGFSFISSYSLAMLFCVFSRGLFVEDYSAIMKTLGSGREDGSVTGALAWEGIKAGQADWLNSHKNGV